MPVWVSVLENLSVLAGSAMLVFFIGLRWDLREGALRARLAAGLVFGIAAALVILVPIQGPDEATFDTRAGPVLVASFLYGPLAGAVAAVIGAVTRYEVGGAFQIGGAVSPFLYLMAGLLFRRVWPGAQVGAGGYAALAILGTVCVLPAFFIGTGWGLGASVVSKFWPVLLGGNLIGTLMLGLLMERLGAFAVQRLQTQAVLANANDGILTLDETDRVIDANPAALSLLGRSRPEILGAAMGDLLSAEPDALARIKIEPTALDSPASSFDSSVEVAAAVRPDGDRRLLSYSTSFFTVDGRRRGVIILRDMTDAIAYRTELERMLGELAKQLQLVAKANQSKTLFLANMSHELRTPLNAILGFSELMETLGPRNIPEPKLRDYIRDIRSSGAVLLHLVDTVMDINRIERGDAIIQLEKVDAASLLAAARRMASIGMGQRQQLTLALTDGQHMVRCDPTAMMQCIGNLVVNALKHGGDGVSVTLSVSTSLGRTEIDIQDDGQGIPNAVLDRLGDPFVRGEASLRRSIPGVGLGLAITKRLVEEQGGTLVLWNRPEGGVCARISLETAPPDSRQSKDAVTSLSLPPSQLMEGVESPRQ